MSALLQLHVSDQHDYIAYKGAYYIRGLMATPYIVTSYKYAYSHTSILDPA